MPPISKQKIKKLWVTARNLGVDEESLRDLVESITGSRSISKMSEKHANNVIDALKGKYRPGFASSREVWKIYELAKELGWDEPQRLRGFLKKNYNVEDPRWLTSEMSWRCIEGLKVLLRKQKQQASG